MAKAADLDFLRQVAVFGDLADEHLTALSARLKERRVKKGEVLFREGDAGEEMFLIRGGDVVISKPVVGRV